MIQGQFTRVRQSSLVSTLKGVGLFGWVKAVLFVVVLLVVFASPLEQLAFREWQSEDYSYCSLVPLAALFLVFDKRRELLSAEMTATWKGLFPLGLGIVVFWAGGLAGSYLSEYLSLWLVIIGLLWTQFGWDRIKAAWFPLVLLFAAFPLPSILNMKISFLLKLISSALGVKMLQLCGMSAYREGNMIDLGFTQLQVVDACSGLRYAFPLMVLSAILAYWFRGHFWKRAVLFLSAIPVAVGINSFRIAATGIAYASFGPKVAEGFFHDFSGWLIFVLAIPFLLLEMSWLKRLPPRQILPGPAKKPLKVPGSQHVKGSLRISRTLLFAIAVMLILAALLPSRIAGVQGQIPSKKKLHEFPLQIGEWTGSREELEQKFLDTLKLSDYTLINYSDFERRQINFYVAYYESQLKGEGIHLPDSCLPGSGWYFEENGVREIGLSGGGRLRVNRIVMEKEGSKELTYYWFDQRGRAFPGVWELRLYAIVDGISRKRSDGALVRLVTPVYKSEGVDQADGRLQSLVLKIEPLLGDYIPK